MNYRLRHTISRVMKDVSFVRMFLLFYRTQLLSSFGKAILKCHLTEHIVAPVRPAQPNCFWQRLYESAASVSWPLTATLFQTFLLWYMSSSFALFALCERLLLVTVEIWKLKVLSDSLSLASSAKCRFLLRRTHEHSPDVDPVWTRRLMSCSERSSFPGKCCGGEVVRGVYIYQQVTGNKNSSCYQVSTDIPQPFSLLWAYLHAAEALPIVVLWEGQMGGLSLVVFGLSWG